MTLENTAWELLLERDFIFLLMRMFNPLTRQLKVFIGNRYQI